MQLPRDAADLLGDVLANLEEGGFPAMVVGGVATFAWGDPRTTRDLDVATLAAHDETDSVREVLEQAGFEADGPFSTAWGPRFIVPSDTGFPVDVFLDEREALFERRRAVEVEGSTLWVKSPEDVVVEKLLGARRFPDERSRDLEDAVAILHKQDDGLDASYLGARCREEDLDHLLERASQAARDFEA